MEKSKGITPENKKYNEEENSLKGALFSSIVFVGGGIVLFMVLLFIMYMFRL